MQPISIFLDPDGTLGDWMYIIVHAPTQIFYSTQCAGTLCEIRQIEGFLVPIGGASYQDTRDDQTQITSATLHALFHKQKRCYANQLSSQQQQHIQKTIEKISIWSTTFDGIDQRHHLKLDLDHIHELTEAWIPVLTPWGKGICVWKNCD